MTWRSLSKKNEFQRVYEEGAKQVGRFLVVYLLPAGGPENQAQAVVASKKVGGAVQRNRAKRLLRDALFQAHKNGRFDGMGARLAAMDGNPDRFFPVQGDPRTNHGKVKRACGSCWSPDSASWAWDRPEVRAELDDLLEEDQVATRASTIPRPTPPDQA